MFIRFGGILFLAALAVWVYCVLDAVSSDRTQVRRLPKGGWVAIVLLTFIVAFLLALDAAAIRTATEAAMISRVATRRL